MKVLKGQDILALGFMTFALFVGAGNIIFPHSGSAGRAACLDGGAGLSGHRSWLAGHYRDCSGQGRGRDGCLSSPIGKIAGGALAAVCYLAVGPLFASPRTATVSFEVGLAPLTGDTPMALFLYSLVYFLVVFWVSLYPGRLLDTVGRFLAPLKIIALAVLGIAAFALPAGGIGRQSRRTP